MLNWMNAERLELHDERKAHRVIFQQVLEPDGLADGRFSWDAHLNPTTTSPSRDSLHLSQISCCGSVM